MAYATKAPSRNRILIPPTPARLVINTDGSSAVPLSVTALDSESAVPATEVMRVVSAPADIPIEPNISSHSTMVVCESAVPLYKNPTKEFDSVLIHVPYSVRVTVHEQKGQWARIQYHGLMGWVNRAALCPSRAQVEPFFVIKEYCGPDAENTRRVRRLIDDVFNAGAIEMPLQAEEYVYFRLLQRGFLIPKVPERPRQAGTWQRIFTKDSGVRSSHKPKTGSVMEYVDAHEHGHVAFVEAVFPDQSITVSEVGTPEPGYYNERTLSQTEWQSLAPRFIIFA